MIVDDGRGDAEGPVDREHRLQALRAHIRRLLAGLAALRRPKRDRRDA
ncbi:hypothetical protein [Methylobacterium sp. A54F]